MLSASKCIVCGSGPLISDAGYYFCADCGAQQEGRETEQEFGAFGQQGRRINKPKKDRDLDAQKKERAKKLREDPYLTERALSQKDYPFWLDQIGTRLCTSTKILAKCSSVLINEFNVPEKFMEKSKFIFYNYLRYFGIAFCNEEITDDSNKLFCPLVRHRNVEIEKKLAQNKKRATNLRKILEKERKEKSDAWIDLTSTNEALEKVLEEEEAEIAASLEEVQFVERINTSLSVEAVNMAASIYLGIDLLLCILFLSLNLSGCRWILLSDIFRWYREGRFNISRSQLLALNFSTFWTVEENPNIKDMITSDNVERRFYVRNRYTIPYLAIQPISESLRVLAFITQFVDIPRCIETLDFQKVLSRFVYNLNLPKVFLKHLITICSFLPDVNVDYGAERFSYVQPVDKGLRQHLLFLSSSGARSHKSLGFVSFFQRAFLVNKSQKCWEKVEGTEVYDRIDPLLKYGSHWHFVPLPTEVKAVAIILFTLKLFFGLDDQREYSLKAKQQIMEDEELNFFNFGEWLYQLEMRTHCWQGTDAKVVMSNDFYFDQLERSGFQESSLIALFQRPHLGMRIYTNNRFLPFRGCIPNNIRVQSQPYIFENLFPTYLAPTPSKVLRSDDNINLNMSNEALFTPLQYQSLKNNNIKNKSSKIIGIDKNKKRIFFNNFYETNLDLELPSNLNSSEPIECNIIQKMFPCANNYKRYSPGFYKNIAILIPEFDENGFTNEQLHNQIRINSLPITPLLATKPLKMLLLSTERQFSKSFGRLLKHLALAACETDHLLFFTFQMIETMFFERTNFNRIRNDLCQYGRFMFYTYRNSQSSKRETNSRFRYTINLDKQLNNNYNIPTNKFCFKLTRAHERNLHVFNKKEIEDNIIFQRCFFYDVNPQNIIPAAPFEVSGPFTFIQPQYKKVTVSDSDHTDDEDLVNNTKNIEIGDFLSSSSSSNDSDDDLLEENIQRPTERTGKKYPIKMVSLPAPISLALCALKYW